MFGHGKKKTEPAKPRLVDVPGILHQASQKFRVRDLLRMGKRDITLLSRDKIEQLINTSVRAAVDKCRSEGGGPVVTISQLQAESKAQFEELLRKATFAAKTSADPAPDILRLIRSFATEKPVATGGCVELVDDAQRRIRPFSTMDLDLGKGLDVGTVNICAAARMRKTAEPVFNLQRNAFLDLRNDPFCHRMLARFGLDFVSHGDRTYVAGDPAFQLAALFEKSTRRPMKDGTVSRDESEALFVVNYLVAQLLGRPQKPGEVCVYSVPADTIDSDRSFIYHRAALDMMIQNLGYTPKPMLESHLIVFAELKDRAYTGIGISCGGGMFNVCVSYKGVPALTFSTSRGGDWIDQSVADAIGIPPARVAAVKEGPMNLLRPQGRIEEAIAIYTRHLLQYTLEMIRSKIGESQNMPNFAAPVDIVCSGGTSLTPGFLQLFRDEFKKFGLPIPVAEIRAAANPLQAVAAGCVQAAIEETRAPSDAGVQVAPAALERAAVQGKPRRDSEARHRLEAFAKPAPELGRTPPSNGGRPLNGKSA